MALEKVKEYFKKFNLNNKILVFNESTATISEASKTVGVSENRIAKTLSFLVNDEPILIVVAGDARIENNTYKHYFHKKAKMIPPYKVEEYIGHDIGGVCPFAINDNVKTYLDVSLKRFGTVFPACGSSNSAIELTPLELEKYSQNFVCWVDVCKDWRDE